MLEKLLELEKKCEMLTEKIAQPEVFNNPKIYKEYNKELSEIEPVLEKAKQYKKVLQNLSEAKEIIDEGTDKELVDLAIADLEILKEE
ncbi:MAG TPA: PCRF domain-containing protein, partial [bacterium]|nr:PCRF domain-containing protein [bacterium]